MPAHELIIGGSERERLAVRISGGRSDSASTEPYDRWLDARVLISVGGFNGDFDCALLPTDFERFGRDLERLREDLSRSSRRRFAPRLSGIHVRPTVQRCVGVARLAVGRRGCRLGWFGMPTVLRIGSTRFFFYSNEGAEPPHIHVERAGALAKFWLNPVSLASSTRFGGHELRRLERQVTEHQHQFLEAWNDYFGA